MIYQEGGLVECFDVFKELGDNVDFSKGIGQAIGYKEFYRLY